MGKQQYVEWRRLNAYNKCKRRAIKGRKHPTEAEELMWHSLQQLNSTLPTDIYFQRQYVQMPYILDFYCKKTKVCIEVDGSIHDNSVTEDHKRDLYLECNFGIVTWRIKNEVVYDFERRQRFLESLKRGLINKP